MANFKTVPNQKVVKVNKEVCNKQNLYAAINLEAMDAAAKDLEAGAFKLWVYFAKNQDNYEFALSSKDVQDTFGIKIKQYNNAVDALIEKGYLVRQGDTNYYTFNEIAVITKEDNENCVITKSNNTVITKEDNSVITKSNNRLLPQDIRNNTDTTYNNTIDNTEEMVLQPTAASTISLESGKGTVTEPIVIRKERLRELYHQKPQNWKSFDAIGLVYHLPTMCYYKAVE